MTPPGPETERDRRYLLALIKARASCQTLLVTMWVVAILIAFEVPLDWMRALGAGAAVAAWGLHNWADMAIEKNSKTLDNRDEGK